MSSHFVSTFSTANITQPFVQAFPQAIERDVLILLQNRTIEFWRYCGGELAEVLGLEEWVVLKTIVNDIELASKRIGRTCADDAFKQQVLEPSLADETERDAFLQKLHEESDMPLDLLLRLWLDEKVKIRSVGTSSFEERLAELKAENKNQLESMWKSRVYVPAQIYGSALGSLDTSPLKDQLCDLLHIHLAQDLIPSTLKRIRTKGLLREQSSHKQVEKLEAAVSSQKEVPITKSIEKFHERMGFTTLPPEEATQASAQQLASMVNAMADDTDAPRLFLTTVLVLLSSRRKGGTVYATGKFAPRLLRLLKADVEEEQYKSLERLKDAVKAGSVTDDDRAEMRRIAANALESSTIVGKKDDMSATPED